MAEATRTVTFGSAVGMHARPAATIAKAAAASGHTVLLESGGKKANGASVLLLLALGVQHGDDITLTVSGDDPESAANELAELLGSELDTED